MIMASAKGSKMVMIPESIRNLLFELDFLIKNKFLFCGLF